jgi:hypothetical protein
MWFTHLSVRLNEILNSLLSFGIIFRQSIICREKRLTSFVIVNNFTYYKLIKFDLNSSMYIVFHDDEFE